MSLHDKYIMATGYRRVDDDIIDVDIFCNDEYRTSYIVTLRRIANYTIPQEYITINKTTVMANNVEVYCGDSMMNSDIIKEGRGTSPKPSNKISKVFINYLTSKFTSNIST